MRLWNGVEFRPNGPAFSEAALHVTEMTLGLKLPADYAEFLLAVNGRLPPKEPSDK